MCAKKISSIASSITASTGTISTTGTIGISQPYWSSGTYTTSSVPDKMEGKAINLDRLMDLPDERREVVMDILNRLSSSSYDIKNVYINTLETYGILEDNSVLKRKVKIEKAIKE